MSATAMFATAIVLMCALQSAQAYQYGRATFYGRCRCDRLFPKGSSGCHGQKPRPDGAEFRPSCCGTWICSAKIIVKNLLGTYTLLGASHDQKISLDALLRPGTPACKGAVGWPSHCSPQKLSATVHMQLHPHTVPTSLLLPTCKQLHTASNSNPCACNTLPACCCLLTLPNPAGTDAWSIHKGSCSYGYLDYQRATGWDVAAISDRAPDYQGSCG